MQILAVRAHNIALEIKLSLQLGYFVMTAVRNTEYPKYWFSSRQEPMQNREIYFHVVVYLSNISGYRKISGQRITVDLHREVFDGGFNESYKFHSIA